MSGKTKHDLHRELAREEARFAPLETERERTRERIAALKLRISGREEKESPA